MKANIQITNEDNMKLMARYPDNHFELAIVDPPYGIKMAGRGDGSGKLTKHRWKQHTVKDWDNETPPLEYFCELFRVSKNQIVWGANYFISKMPYDSRCWLTWDKMQVFSLADFELAWTSFDKPCRAFRMTRGEATNEKKGQAIHPTQKPVKLYEWILDNYATCKSCHNEGGCYEDVAGDGGSQMWQHCDACDGVKPKILDTHLGSGSIAIACHNRGFDLTACELDKEYYEAALKRLNQHRAQIRMF